MKSKKIENVVTVNFVTEIKRTSADELKIVKIVNDVKRELRDVCENYKFEKFTKVIKLGRKINDFMNNFIDKKLFKTCNLHLNKSTVGIEGTLTFGPFITNEGTEYKMLDFIVERT